MVVNFTQNDVCSVLVACNSPLVARNTHTHTQQRNTEESPERNPKPRLPFSRQPERQRASERSPEMTRVRDKYEVLL